MFVGYSAQKLMETVGEAFARLSLDAWQYFLQITETLLILGVIYLLLVVLIYWRAHSVRRISAAEKRQSLGKRALFVIAHPDDECMFFGPTILQLAAEGTEIYLLCLSIGNYYKEGGSRRTELYDACDVLNIKKSNIIICIDKLMPDDPSIYWPTDHLAKIINLYVEMYSIDSVITFDKHGVSGHLNHSAIFYSIARLFLEKHVPNYCKVYILDSVNILRKYWGYFDLPLSYVLSTHWYVLGGEGRKTVVKAMKQHKSQMLWFRHLYLVFSRFILINTLRHVTLTDLELELQIED